MTLPDCLSGGLSGGSGEVAFLSPSPGLPNEPLIVAFRRSQAFLLEPLKSLLRGQELLGVCVQSACEGDLCSDRRL